jgi:alpha-beta hydrolase superfamily lysophospholipase
MNQPKFLERAGEPRLAYRVQAPASGKKGRVLMVHGYAEHSARYDKVVDLFTEHGLVVARFDLRGHGNSEGLRGHVTEFDDYVRDVYALLKALDGDPVFSEGPPPVLFGHSLGGLIATHAALSLNKLLSGLALSSPFYGLALAVPKVQVILGKLVAKLTPTLKQPSGLKGTDLTHDAALAATYDHDPLHFDHVTVGWFGQVAKAQERLQDRAPRLELPVFCIAAGEDRVVAVEKTRQAFAGFRSKDKELDVRSGLFHEILNEPDWRDHAVRFAERAVRWSNG